MEKRYTDRFSQTINFGGEEKARLLFEKRSSGDLFIRLTEALEKLELTLEADQYSYTKVYIQNESQKDVEIKLHAIVNKDAKIELGVLDLQDKEFDFDLISDLNEQGATFEVFTGQLCNEHAVKTGNMKVSHHEKYTYGNMHNFAVVNSKGDYKMVADGSIQKGCTGSESHQETRVLTLGHDHRVEAIPILYIDENDVKASHALTVGQPDENQLYYLQSRGLNKAQAMGLLSIGYFMPVISLISDEEVRENVRKTMERKVGLHGHSEEY